MLAVLGKAILLFLLVCISTALKYEYDDLGGEKAAYNLRPFKDAMYANWTDQLRQEFCERSERVRSGRLALKDALRGLQISVFLTNDQYFHYSENAGIDPEYPGLIAHLLDMIADRAGFTWRNSFGVIGIDPQEYNMTWTEVLWWGVNTFDMGAGWWEHDAYRMELGINFLEPWYDASQILVDKLTEDELDASWSLHIFWNWLRPFELPVWYLMGATIVLSSFVYQLIEHMQGERQDRPLGQWFMDNLYLSTLNTTQNFEYAPATWPGRICALSMATWALVITSTYTANLANLFVDSSQPVLPVTSMELAVAKKVPVCTYQNTNSDFLVKKYYKNAVRVPKVKEVEMFQALQTGECSVALVSLAGWTTFQRQEAFNPDCNIRQVGGIIGEINAGFAMKADLGYQCTSLLRDVFNLYFRLLMDEGKLKDAWELHASYAQDIDCNAPIPETIAKYVGFSQDNEGRQRRNLHRSKPGDTRGRKLSAKGALSGGSTSHGHEKPLSLEQMIGTFALHYLMMGVAILASLLSPYWIKLTNYWGWEEPEQLIVRSHGPVVGPPPGVETNSIRSRRHTAIHAYGTPIGKPKRMTINTFVLPEKALHDIPEISKREEFLDEFDTLQLDNTDFPKIMSEFSQRRLSKSQNISSCALADLQDHFDAKIQHTNEQCNERMAQYEETLSQHMGMMLAMFGEMKKRDEQRDEQLRALLGGTRRQQQTKVHKVDRTVASPSNIAEEQTLGKKDFGHYLRKPAQKRDFGKYVRNPSESL